MGKATGFLEYKRITGTKLKPSIRIKNYKEFTTPLSKEDQQIQASRCMDCGVPFCQYGGMMANAASGCPVNNLIPEWNDLIYKGMWKTAVDRLLKTNNFPEFTGRVCPAPCEGACTDGLHGEPVTIKENELSIIENAFAEGYIKPNPPKERTGKRVAVIGAGPAGLACGDMLNRKGHDVTIIERADRPGGLLMYGIPNMKLDKQIVARRVEFLEAEGVKFSLNHDITKTEDIDKFMSEYDAVVLACGATKPRDLIVEGRDLKGIHFAVDFLKATTKSLLDSELADNNYISAKDLNVVVIGGGDTGTDCIATSLRHGAKSLVQLEIMGKAPEKRAENNPWPQYPKVLKTDYGQDEFIDAYGKDPREYCTSVKKFIGDENGNVKEAVIVKVEWVKNENGAVIPKEISGSEQVIKADLVLLAMGFVGAEESLIEKFNVEKDNRGNVKAEYMDFATSVPKVYSCGDVRRGQSLVVWAIKEGRECAEKVDLDIMGAMI